MPVDDAFARHDMAVLYDAFNSHGDDKAFYLGLADTPCRVLDIGCGTGSIGLALADLGHAVTGLDPAPGMLAVARSKDMGHRVHWVEGSALDPRLSLDEKFDLVIMTGHVFQVFLDDAETRAMLDFVRRHLAPEGRLVFESRNPLARAWDHWTEGETREFRDVDGIGPVEVFYQVKAIEGEHVTFDAVFTLLETSERRLSESRLRFADRETIGRLLTEAGFAATDWLGDFDGSPSSATSPEIIPVARVQARPA
ncbi:methyltransferase [Rhizobium sp. Root274]|uniref:class I SAM-dependent methyltransferase n=1 Tax=unclassified Rhizobium TaxID=2613769 RepID=UPI00071559DA|nr:MULTISPECIES: class I SAM-dependent methyltransferase [unclassified Rhizobium]KQW31946.1 methyltransferase [Rhizobium sp. Root1240]KRD33485.1 methyltransferase [Rhizobium sp. Root274]